MKTLERIEEWENNARFEFKDKFETDDDFNQFLASMKRDSLNFAIVDSVQNKNFSPLTYAINEYKIIDGYVHVRNIDSVRFDLDSDQLVVDGSTHTHATPGNGFRVGIPIEECGQIHTKEIVGNSISFVKVQVGLINVCEIL